MSNAVSAQGVKVQRSTDGIVYSDIAEVADVGGPDESVDQIECTHLGSTGKEFIGGLKDGGEVQCEANAISSDSQQRSLYSDFQSSTKRYYKILCPDGEAHAFQAIITKHGRKFGANAVRKVNFTLKISGAVTPTWPS